MNQPYPRLPGFKYFRPDSTREAVEFLSEHANQSRPYIGGTDCFVQIRDRKFLPEYLVDLKGVAAYHRLSFSKEGLLIGAAVPMNTVANHPEIRARYPVLVEAIREVGGYQLRTRATVIGNLCNASPGGDTIGPCLVYGTEALVAGSDGERTVPLTEFFKGPGKTCLEPSEIVTALRLPFPPKGAQGVYRSIGRNKLGDLAIAAVTVLGYPETDNPSGFAFKISLSAVAPTVIFAEEAQALLAEEALNRAAIERASDLCARACKPIDDIRSSAEYRRDMIRVLARQGLEETCKKLGIVI